MMISEKLNQAMNEQIGHEFGANMQYLAIAAHFHSRYLTLLANLFFEQAEEEKEHAMRIPQIKAPQPEFESAVDAVEAALNWEMEVTRQINNLMDIAVSEKDYLARGMLQWFVDEQLEEINKMDQLLSLIRRAGENNLLMVEAYLIHTNRGDED
jgi:ferritin